MSDPTPVIEPDLVSLDQDLGDDTAAIIRALAARLQATGRASDAGVLTQAVLAREALGPTALPSGIAMPHARSASVVTPSIAVARLAAPTALSPGADPVRLVLLVAAGADPQSYLGLLQRVAAACVRGSFVTDLLEASSAAAVADLVREAVA